VQARAHWQTVTAAGLEFGFVGTVIGFWRKKTFNMRAGALVIVMLALQRGSAGQAGFSSLQYLSKVYLRLHQPLNPTP
jgi:hypothetical protein